jgi:hypothetical protein
MNYTDLLVKRVAALEAERDRLAAEIARQDANVADWEERSNYWRRRAEAAEAELTAKCNPESATAGRCSHLLSSEIEDALRFACPIGETARLRAAILAALEVAREHGRADADLARIGDEYVESQARPVAIMGRGVPVPVDGPPLGVGPASLVGARHDRVHKDVGTSRPAAVSRASVEADHADDGTPKPSPAPAAPPLSAENDR